ncbi:peptide/nickel transport system substrate-binding protein [Actinoplanes lutulentus]|uniref:Peptide/nickel transport system substrate-binding protein n=1 Tax=Actinoplanes lutulentus TaxID=1287878 RepID=A0A327ZJW0_9ACTN|nr:ABC transporter substrate-binding protein [Actinoplanes lutulentus]MBB2940812.1 peptide/nickel transport system substrate-binding protein [Actinoplanes lutulentus]RAK43122.1 peptide/nickel transport system substrate-binding protein [Actinoplanes lutulentus]
MKRFALIIPILLLGACANGASGAGAEVGDTLRLGLSRQITGVNPHKGGSPDSSGSIVGSIYESLTRITPSLEVEPSLATSWTSPDPLNWDFTIRTNAKFSDGSALTADDVAWNFAQLLNPDYKGTSGAPLRKYIKKVTASSPDVIHFELSAPALDLPGRLWSIYIVQPAFAQSHNLDNEALGSGPYKLDKLDQENGAALSLNPSYGGDKPAFEKVEYTVLASEAQRVAALRAGEQDLILNLDPLDLKQFEGSPDYDTILGVGTQPLTLAINERKKNTPLANAKVRQALNYATDKETIIKTVLRDAVKPLPGQVLYSPYQTPNPAVSAYPFDSDRAKALLAEAGYPNGFEVRVNLSSGTYVSQDVATQQIAAQWAKIGVTLKIEQQPFPAWLQNQYGPDDQAADFFYIMWGGSYRGDLNGNFGPFRSDHIQSHLNAPEFDKLVDQALGATDQATKDKFQNEAAASAFENAHAIFLYPSPFTGVVSKQLSWTPKPNRYLYAQQVGRK